MNPHYIVQKKPNDVGNWHSFKNRFEILNFSIQMKDYKHKDLNSSIFCVHFYQNKWLNQLE